MRNIPRRQFLSTSVALLAFPAIGSAQTDAPVRKPRIEVGDRWTYRSTDLIRQGTDEHEIQVTFVSAQTVLAVSVLKRDGKEIETTWTPEWNAVVSSGGRVFRPDSGFFRFPLRVGDSYKMKSEWVEPKNKITEGVAEGDVRIVGWESVEVPAGTFRVIRLAFEFQVLAPSGNAPRFRGYFLYAPDVGRWVRMVFVGPKMTTSEELLAYKLV